MKSTHLRIILLATLALMVISLFSRWEAMYGQPPTNEAKQQSQQHNTAHETNKQVGGHPPTDLSKSNVQANFSDHKPFVINTNVFKNVKISPVNGAIIGLALKDYPISTENQNPLPLLTNQDDQYYIAQNKLIVNGKPTTVTFSKHNIQQKDHKTIVTLVGQVDDLTITKRYVFNQDNYAIDVSQTVQNNGQSHVEVQNQNTLVRRTDPDSGSFSIFNPSSFTFKGIALSSDADKFQKIDFSSLSQDQKKIDITTPSGWAAMVQHYFLSAWVPATKDQSDLSVFAQSSQTDNQFETGTQSQVLTLQPNQEQTFDSQLYVGPIIKQNLAAVAPHLDLTLDYGILSFISVIVFWLMSHIHSVVGNWGLAIILVTLVIKMIFYPLSAKSYRSMAKMRLLQPRIKKLQEMYKEDRQKLGQKMMALYREEKVNPLGGCLPILVQIPVFIALYWVLMESVELRQAPFIFWIQNLSAKDPYYVLPVLMGLSMLVQQRLNPAATDPTQAKIMMILPVVFTFFFAAFPSGLVLYWLTNNVLSILQQWYITKTYTAKLKHKS